MNLINKNFYCFIVFILTSSILFSQKSPAFTIILDAGHGGKDPGNSYHGFIEKDIALKTTLKVGDMLEKEGGFKVIYTRTSDVFIELANRPKIANEANANLFVSIHCNSVKNLEPSGTETFVMGLSRSDMNLEVAKNENSVILLEDNYKEKYQAFDPTKPESLIGIKLMQEENLNSSINLATKIQDNFTFNLSRKSRGVKQQPLWVLDAASMPSVLIELGFLSNKEEGRFLNSDEGQSKIASQISNAIINYKNEYFGGFVNNEDKIDRLDTKQEDKSTSDNSKETKNSSPTNNSVLTVQIFAPSKKIDLKSKNFNGLEGVTRVDLGKIYKYFYGETVSVDEANKLKEEAQKKGYIDAFIVYPK